MITVIKPEWNLSTWTIEDDQLARRLYQIVDERTTTARALDLTVPIYCTVTYDVSLLAGPELGAQLLYSPLGDCTVVFNQEGQALTLQIDKELGTTVTVHYTGQQPSRSLIEQRLRALETLSLLPPEAHPYGWIEDGRISTLLFMAEYDYSKKRKRFVGGEPCVYVLEGTSIPQAIHMEEDDIEWPHRIVRLLQSGQLILLRDRFHTLTGEVWSGTNEQGRYISFTTGDNKQPELVTNALYLHWHPREAYPGELFTYSPTTERLRLRKYLGW